MNESEQRALDTKQQHEAFMKSSGYIKHPSGKWVPKNSNIQVDLSRIFEDLLNGK